ncbi:hypothetical protein [Roseospira goensis]|uniref:3-hydroxy-3-methylglutaryl CoA synthase n=1 Tax=Roseospira goensis TaxID=391922 RepID=A0A7W6RXR5_9PROT|nr:hypothetical protein [Roseospira goensis]MBB4285186.1 3-hydroxy-3-methylglutaryl CoA synthase [Roseospira goensis]
MTAAPVGLSAYAARLPRLRLPAAAYRDAWGTCAARGLERKAVCAYDEDAVTLAVAAARAALTHSAAPAPFDALILGATSLPYDEKPSAATVLSALTARRDVRVVEIGGSPQAGLQALLVAWEYCAAHPGRSALAVAADAPAAPADVPHEHALGAGAAAFLVGPDTAAATLCHCAAVTLETFGARLRRRGEATLRDLELRTDTVAPALADLRAAVADWGPPDRLAVGGDAAAARRAGGVFGLSAPALSAPWARIGDCGAALAPLALCDALDRAAPGERVMAVAFGAGALALDLTAGPGLASGRADTDSVAVLADGGEEIGYVAYLRHRRMLSSRLGGTA